MVWDFAACATFAEEMTKEDLIENLIGACEYGLELEAEVARLKEEARARPVL